MKNKKVLTFPLIMFKEKMCIKWNSKISGIYAWINEVNGKMYIGRATNLYKRIYDEMNNFQNNKPQNLIKLENAIRKYGIDNFRVVRLLECPREYLDKLERLLIEYYDTKKNGYNCTYGGEGTAGHIVTPEQIKKQRKIMELYWTDEKKKEHSNKMKEWFDSKSKDEQDKMRSGHEWWLDVKCKEKHLEKTRKSLTPDRIEKQRKSILKYYKTSDEKGHYNKNHYHKKAIKQEILSPSNEVIKIIGLSNFCEEHHFDYHNIKNVLIGKRKHFKGWHIDPNFQFIPKPFKKIVSPDGIIYEFQSTLKFCREHRIDCGGIKKVLNKKIKHYRLWRLPETSLEDAINNKNSVYQNVQFQFPDNHIEKITDRGGFCKKYGFPIGYLYRFLKTKPIGSIFHGLKLMSK